MREIIFDTETTGLDNRMDRIIEIGGIELFNHFPTGNTLHIYINPGDQKVHPDALAVHGITDEFLKDKKAFAEIAEEILAFFGDAKWIAHNATFDMGFINAEFARIGLPPILPERVVDTLSMARRKHPMRPKFARRALPALRRRQFAPRQTRRASRLRTAGRSLYRNDRRPAGGPWPRPVGPIRPGGARRNGDGR